MVRRSICTRLSSLRHKNLLQERNAILPKHQRASAIFAVDYRIMPYHAVQYMHARVLLQYTNAVYMCTQVRPAPPIVPGILDTSSSPHTLTEYFHPHMEHHHHRDRHFAWKWQTNLFAVFNMQLGPSYTVPAVFTWSRWGICHSGCAVWSCV